MSERAKVRRADASGIAVRGGASAEELAAVIAVVGSRGATQQQQQPEDALTRWRERRRTALRRSGPERA